MQITRNWHYSVGGQMHKRSIISPGKKSYKVIDIETGLVSRKKDIKNIENERNIGFFQLFFREFGKEPFK